MNNTFLVIEEKLVSVNIASFNLILCMLSKHMKLQIMRMSIPLPTDFASVQLLILVMPNILCLYLTVCLLFMPLHV